MASIKSISLRLSLLFSVLFMTACAKQSDTFPLDDNGLPRQDKVLVEEKIYSLPSMLKEKKPRYDEIQLTIDEDEEEVEIALPKIDKNERWICDNPETIHQYERITLQRSKEESEKAAEIEKFKLELDGDRIRFKKIPKDEYFKGFDRSSENHNLTIKINRKK